MARTTQVIKVIGDSHCEFFKQSKYMFGRSGLPFSGKYKVQAEPIHAASIMGFRPNRSTLDTKAKVANVAKSSRRLILAFGQVDLELGYYYRHVIKDEHHTPSDFCSWLTHVYIDFIETVDLSDCEVAIKGMNLTALSPEAFATDYISRIISGEGRPPTRDDFDKIRKNLLNEDQQNKMHLEFNKKLEEMADSFGFKYFDLISQTAVKGQYGLPLSPPRLANEFKTAAQDHHLADTVAVRRMHFEAAGRAFGF